MISTALGHAVRRGASVQVHRRWRRVLQDGSDFTPDSPGRDDASGTAYSSDSESDADSVAASDSDSDLSQMYSLPSGVPEAIEARQGRVGGRL